MDRASVGMMMAAMAAERLAPTAGHVELASLYRQHYRSLVRLASLLVDDVAVCEELAQDAFVRFATRRRALQQPERADAYLRSIVLNGARSHLRRRDPRTKLRLVRPELGERDAPDAVAGRHDDSQAVLLALRTLPDRQRDVLVLRYWMELSEAEIAATLGIGAGTVKTHARRGLESLATRLEDRR
ncbi:MAG: SigE family RNA polymerase sigma factor [Acidimicrobiales bacterium]